MQPSIIQKYGYTWVALPKESLLPLTLLEKIDGGVFQRLFHLPSSASRTNSTIYDLFPEKGSSKPVTLKNPEKVAFFNGFDISKKGGGLSVKGLKSIGAVGNVDAGGTLDQASMLLYTFKSPTVIGIHTEVLLEEHLNLTPVNANAAGYLEKLHAGKLYVVTEVLQCQEFSVEDGSSLKINGYANLETLNGHLGAIKANGQLDNKLSNILSYAGTAPLTFALKARQIRMREQNGKVNYGLYEEPLKKVRSGQLPDAEELEEDSISID